MEATERTRKNALLFLAVWLRIVSGALGCALVALLWSAPLFGPGVRGVWAVVSPDVAAPVLAVSGLLMPRALEMVAARLSRRYIGTQAPSRALRWLGMALCWFCALASLSTLVFIGLIKFAMLL